MKKPKIIGVQKIPLSHIENAPHNANVMSDEDSTALANAVDQLGFLQPLLVAKVEEGRFRIIDGHHRAEAAAKAGFGSLDCLVIETDLENEAVIALSMNKIRGELNLGEVAKVFAGLEASGWTTSELQVTGFTPEEIDDFIKATSTVSEEEVVDTSAAFGAEEEERPEPGGPFTLELNFAAKADLQRAKKALRKAAGKGRELGDGLLQLLDGADEG